jgi:hypothetical protein
MGEPSSKLGVTEWDAKSRRGSVFALESEEAGGDPREDRRVGF